jgi:hypothetical protein
VVGVEQQDHQHEPLLEVADGHLVVLVPHLEGAEQSEVHV